MNANSFTVLAHLVIHLYLTLLRVTDAEATEHRHDTLSGDTPGTDHDCEEHFDNDLPKSPSSTIAGKILRPCVMVHLFIYN